MFSLGKKLGLVGSLSPNISRKARREKTVKRTQEEGYFWLKDCFILPVFNTADCVLSEALTDLSRNARDCTSIKKQTNKV